MMIERKDVSYMKDVIHIIGHKNPDTDSIVSSIAYAELKRTLGINAIACRIGDLNTETDFVLKKFKVAEPVYIQTAKCKLYDIPFDEAVTVSKDCTIKEAWDRINRTKNRALYVVDKEEKLLGVVSISDITSILMNERSTNKVLMKKTPVDNIRKVLKGEFLYEAPSYRTNGNVHILASKKSFEDADEYKDSIVVMSDDLELQKKVICSHAACLILVNVDIVSGNILRLAKEYGCTIIKTVQDMLWIARNIYKAPNVELIMERKIIAFHNHAYIGDVYTKMSKTRYRSYPVLNNQGKVLGAISRYHLLNYKKKKFILLDHNEGSQSIDDLNEGEVMEIIDHHRIGDIETSSPIRFRNEIIGSTCTIISKIYKENGIIPQPEIAAILCCAIISDTMNFNSPTTTAVDRAIAAELADIAGIHLPEIAKEMFSAVATLKGRSLSEILYNDFKEYNIEGKRIAIGQINIAEEEEVREIKEDFIDYMHKINEINKFDLLMMCFTNVEGTGSNLVFIGHLSWMVDEVFKDDIMDDMYFVDSVISRKKQIIPALSKAFQNL